MLRVCTSNSWGFIQEFHLGGGGGGGEAHGYLSQNNVAHYKTMGS